MTDITPDKTPEEEPQHIPSPQNRQEGGAQSEMAESEDARDPSRVSLQSETKKPTKKPGDEQKVENMEVTKGLDWADDDKRTVDRRSHPSD
jgi:hypothetical protein